MPVEAKPLFRPDVLRSHLAGFELPPHVEVVGPKLDHWAGLIANRRIDTFNEQQILPSDRLIRGPPGANFTLRKEIRLAKVFRIDSLWALNSCGQS